MSRYQLRSSGKKGPPSLIRSWRKQRA